MLRSWLNGRIPLRRSFYAANAVMRLKDRLLTGGVVGIWFTCDGVSLVSAGETRWVPIEDAYQIPSLYTVYVDPDFIRLGGCVIVLRQLTDYLVDARECGVWTIRTGIASVVLDRDRQGTRLC